MTLDLCIIDWVAIGSLATGAMTIATFITLKNNKKQFLELQKQNYAIQKQSFENTIFQLLHEVKKILLEVSNTPPNGYRTSGFSNGLAALESEYKIIPYIGTGETDIQGNELKYEPTLENMQKSYKARYESMSNLGSYFRSLYRVIKFIDESSYSVQEKYQYTSFIRAQLTDVELLWIFYNCTVGYGVEKFKPLVEKWTLLKNIPISRLIDANHIFWINSSSYDRSKFKK